jgi:hypothetical protein
MLGQGMNLQQCNKAIFVGITFKFNDLIQACHRIQRFGQTRRCHVHIVHAESEREVVATLGRKWAAHRELTTTCPTSSASTVSTSCPSPTRSPAPWASTGSKPPATAGAQLVNNDCVDETARMDTDSVDLIVTSIPFSNHYEYTPSYNDFGHTDTTTTSGQQMDYLTPQLLRVLKPGRIYACHVKDRILFGNVTGAGVPTVSPFHAEALMHGRRHGFDYLGMITVVTDVVRENNQTYRLGWSEQCKDATKMGVGSPEYVLLFHKPQTDRTKRLRRPARHQVEGRLLPGPVAGRRARLLALEREPGADPGRARRAARRAAVPPVHRADAGRRLRLRVAHPHRRILDGRGALPATFMSLAPGSWHPEVWHDVNRMLTLNSEQSRRAQVMHICPLQFDIVDRLISRFSNPGDLVFDPFGGLATVPVRALRAGRRGPASSSTAATSSTP